MPGAMKGIRASTADRKRYYTTIKDAYAEGRIDGQEMELRLHQITQAATYGELDQVVADLPGQEIEQPRKSRRGILLAGALAVAGAATVWHFWPDRTPTTVAPPPTEPGRQIEPAIEPTAVPTGPTLEAEPNPTVGPVSGPVTTDAGRMLVRALGWLEDHGYTHAVRAHFTGGATLSFSIRYHRLDDPTVEDYIAFMNDGAIREYPSGIADPDVELIDLGELKRMNIDGLQQLAIDALDGHSVRSVDIWANRVRVSVDGDDYGRGAGVATFDGAGRELISVEPRD